MIEVDTTIYEALRQKTYLRPVDRNYNDTAFEWSEEIWKRNLYTKYTFTKNNSLGCQTFISDIFQINVRTLTT